MRRTLYEADHDAFRETVRRFVVKEIAPRHVEWEAAGIVPRELYTAAGAQGLLGWAVPEEFGGGGQPDFRFNAVLGEEVVAAGVAGSGNGLCLQNDVCLPYFLDLATPEQKARWLPGIASGELITAIAMTEPGVGSDLASMTTTARREGDVYVVNGAKTFITSGINADLVITAVKTDPTQRHKGMSLLVIERGMPGFERGRNLVQRRPGAGGEPPRGGGPRVRPPGGPPAAGAAGHRRGRRRRCRRGAGDDAGARHVPHGLRSADRRLSEQPVHPRHAGDRGRHRSALRGRLHPRPERRRPDGRRCGQGEVVVHRAPGKGRGRGPPAARRLRLHDRIPHRPRLRRRPGHPYLRRHDRDHEGGHRPGPGPVSRRSAPSPRSLRPCGTAGGRA